MRSLSARALATGKNHRLLVLACGLVLACLSLVLHPAPAPATDRIWTGGSGGDSSWSTGTNWKGVGVPENDDSIIFDSNSVARLNNANSIVGLTGINILAQKTLAADVTVSGNSFSVNANGIDNYSAHTLTINNDFTIPLSIFCVARDGPLIFNGSITITGGDLFLQAFSTNPGTSHFIKGSVSGVGGLKYAADGPTVCEIRAGQGYAGDTVVSTHGTMRLVGPGNLPSGTFLNVEDANSTFDLNGINQTVGHLGGSGQVLLGGATLTTGGDNASSTFKGAISEAGNLVKEGSGTFTLGGNNAFTGSLTINAGTLATSADECLPNACPVTLNSGGLSLGGSQETIGSLAGAAGTTVALGNATLITGGDNSSTTYNGVISGNGGLSKTGAGTFTLAGANTYLGATAVNAGTLRLSGGNDRLPATTSLAVATGATCDLNGNNQTLASLAGSGTVNTGAGVLTIATSLKPGTSPGTITLGNFTLAAAATLTVDLNGTNAGTQYDQVVATGDVTLAGSLALSLGFSPSPGQEFTIINKTSAGAISGTFSGLAEGAEFRSGGHYFRITYVGGDGNDVVLTCLRHSTPQPTPEPKPEPRPAPGVGPDSSPNPTASRAGPQLTWPHVDGSYFYRIYRADCPTCPKQQVGRVMGDGFTDTSARPGWVYYYFIRTENPGGLSDYSDWMAGWRYEQNPGRTGDFDGDGTTDILWWDPETNQIRIWYVGQGQVQSVSPPSQGLDVSRWLLIATGDYNGDGFCDLLWWDPQSGQVNIWYQGEDTGAQAQDQASPQATMTGYATLAHSGDLNGDGRKDLLWCDYIKGQVTIWLLAGDGSPTFNGAPSFQEGYPARQRGGADFASEQVTKNDQPASGDLPGATCDLQWQVAGLADLNGDGRDDVVWQQASDGRVAVWLMDGATVTAMNEYQGQNAAGWRIRALGDMNGDGLADLVWQHQATGAVKVWLMDSDGSIGYQQGVCLDADDPAWQIKGLGDFDADEDLDIFCKNPQTTAARAVTLSSHAYDFAAP